MVCMLSGMRGDAVTCRGPADHLRRCYQRRLRAYPRWYRRERGAEILTVLLDAAAPGQRRPAGGTLELTVIENPAALDRLMWTGFVLGLIVGWPAAVWAAQRHRRHRPGVQSAMYFSSFPVLIFVLMQTATNLTGVLGLVWGIADGSWASILRFLASMWITFLPGGFVVAMAVSAVVTGALAAIPGPAAGGRGVALSRAGCRRGSRAPGGPRS